MGLRGPKPRSELSLVPNVSAIQVVRRPPPPEGLSAEEAAEWVEVVAAMPADWFGREMHGLLVQYCRHVVECKYTALVLQQIKAEKDFDIAAYERALKLQEREGRAASSLATRMRLTQQTKFDDKKKRAGGDNRQGPAKPWE